MALQAVPGIKKIKIGQLVAWRLVAPHWLPVYTFQLSDTLLGRDIFAAGCEPDSSEPTLSYKASINNHTRQGIKKHRLIFT